MLERIRKIRDGYRQNRSVIRRLAFGIFMIWYICVLPEKPFDDPYSNVLLSRNGKLLGAHIASDGQWRFPPSNHTPYKLRVCIIRFEDKNFRNHFGFSITGIGRALLQNLSSGEVRSGGSTITQQVVRIMRKNPPRTYTEKLYEIIIATRMEWSYSKDEILNMYTAHAPFGNNVIGIEAAAWRYFGRTPDELSWAESATLAVLPNAPGLIYPGKNHHSLKRKRNRLLKELYSEGIIDKLSYQLALEEPLPDKPLPLPREAPHLLQLCISKESQQRFVSTIDESLQEMVNQELNQYMIELQDRGIYNGSVLISSSKTGEILAYVGNTFSEEEEFSSDVDCIQAPRSSGSILKPILYAKSMENGFITPEQLLIDVPSRFGNFSPNNFSRQFNGAVPANTALCKSLNVPMVYLLREYGQAKFHNDLKQLGFHHMNKTATHYGLSLILGGGEATNWEINSCYNRFAQQLHHGKSNNLYYRLNKRPKSGYLPMNNGCIYATLNALIEVSRPDEDNNWKAFESSEKIAWKTGTSFGFRDGWAVGVTPEYTVSIWIGNADGEGRPGLTGVKAAAPLLFSIFRKLDRAEHWFRIPEHQMQKTEICSKSGQLPNRFCDDTKWVWVPKSCLVSKPCPYHQLIHTNASGTQRVNSSCEDPANMIHTSWFILPPVVERFYQNNQPTYKPAPRFDPKCAINQPEQFMTFVYPKPGTKLYIPKALDGSRGKVIFEVSHKSAASILYWHIDETFIGTTSSSHQLSIELEKGVHAVTVVDETGLTLSQQFEIMSN